MRLKKYTEYSIFGSKILNSWHSILSAYFLIFFEFLLTPYFGFEKIEYAAGLIFICLLNISVIVLTINSFFRISKAYTYCKIFIIPLFLYFPFSLNKAIFAVSRIRSIFTWFPHI